MDETRGQRQANLRAAVGRRIAARLAMRPAVKPAQPEEVIYLAWANGTSRDELVNALSSWPYTFAEFAPYPGDGMVAGTWQQVGFCYYCGMLSRDEIERIHAAVQPPYPQ